MIGVIIWCIVIWVVVCLVLGMIRGCGRNMERENLTWAEAVRRHEEDELSKTLSDEAWQEYRDSKQR